MRLTRCHVAQPLRVGEEPVLPEHAAAHLSRVLRLRPGDRCVLFNGDGHDYAAQLLAVGKRELRVRILERSAIDNESGLAIVLVQGIGFTAAYLFAPRRGIVVFAGRRLMARG